MKQIFDKNLYVKRKEHIKKNQDPGVKPSS